LRDIEIDTNALDRTPTAWEGISRKLLRNDQESGAFATLLKFEPESHMPRHTSCGRGGIRPGRPSEVRGYLVRSGLLPVLASR
jgi:hypothetical protein